MAFDVKTKFVLQRKIKGFILSVRYFVLLSQFPANIPVIQDIILYFIKS